MKDKIAVIGFLLFLCLSALSCGTRDQDDNPPVETKSWNTFLGSRATDFGCGVVADDNGNVYVAGYSFDAWGAPLAAYTGFNDTFVAKLGNNGGIA